MAAADNARYTLTRTSVKDKMLRLLDQIVVTSDELRQLVSRHLDSMPATEAEEIAAAINQYPPPPIRIPGIPGKTQRKKRSPKRPEVMIAPEAQQSPLAQNVKEAIENVKDPNAELRKELAKITCPGGPAAFNTFRKRLSELFNQIGITITYDRMLEIAGPLYKVMCKNPIYAGTGRDGKPGVPFDQEQLGELRSALERTQSLLRLNPEIMERIQAIAKGESPANFVAPLSNTAVSLQKQRAALGLTKRGTTRKVKNLSAAGAAAAPITAPMASIAPMAPITEEEGEEALSIPTVPLSLGKRIPLQLTQLQREMNSSLTSIQAMRNRMRALSNTVPGIDSHIKKYEKAAEKEMQAIQSLRNQFATIQSQGVASKENKAALKTLLKNATTTLRKTEAQLQNMAFKVNESESRMRAASMYAPLASEKQKTSKLKAAKTKLNTIVENAAQSASSVASVLNSTVNKSKQEVALQTSRAVMPSEPVAASSVAAVKPGPSVAETMIPEWPITPPKNTSIQRRLQLNYLNNGPEDQAKPHRLVKVTIPSKSGTNAPKEGYYLIDSEGLLYDFELANNINSMNENSRIPYIKGRYNKNDPNESYIEGLYNKNNQ